MKNVKNIMKNIGKDFVRVSLVALVAELMIYICDEGFLYDWVFRSIYLNVSDEVYVYILLLVAIWVGVIVVAKLKEVVSKFKIEVKISRK